MYSHDIKKIKVNDLEQGLMETSVCQKGNYRTAWIMALPLLVILTGMLFSTHLEGDGISGFFGSLVFSFFPSFETFRTEHWYLVEWSLWITPLLLSGISLSFIYVIICGLRKKDKQEVGFGFFGLAFMGLGSYYSFIYAINF